MSLKSVSQVDILLIMVKTIKLIYLNIRLEIKSKSDVTL